METTLAIVAIIAIIWKPEVSTIARIAALGLSIALSILLLHIISRVISGYIASSSDWLIMLLAFVVIVHCSYLILVLVLRPC